MCANSTTSHTSTESVATYQTLLSYGTAVIPRTPISRILTLLRYDQSAKLVRAGSRDSPHRSNRYHKPLPTVPGHSFPIDAFCCTHRSIRGFKYCDLMNNASQMIYCNFIKSRAAEDMIKSFKLLWNLNFTWRVFDHAHPDPLNSRYIRMDPGTGYRSDTMLRFMADRRYKIKLTQPRDKHAGGITEHMVGIVTAKTNNAMLENRAPPSFWPCSRPHRT